VLLKPHQALAKGRGPEPDACEGASVASNAVASGVIETNGKITRPFVGRTETILVSTSG